MAIHVSRPFIHLPEHRVHRDDLWRDMAVRHAGYPRLGAAKRIVDQMPTTRRFSQPLQTVLSDRGIEERNATAWQDIQAMGTAAAWGVLKAAVVDPGEVDCVITSHSTGDAVPGLDVHLTRELGLRPTVSRHPMTQAGCNGGAASLVAAVDYVRSRPGSIVLVVIAESLSSIYHHDPAIEQLMYAALWGDSGAAVLVSDRPIGPGLTVVDTWEYLLPGSTDRYFKRLDEHGVHFNSTKAATQSVNDMSPALLEWLVAPLADSAGDVGQVPGEWLDFVIAHTGGPAIIRDLAKNLGIDDDRLRHSWDSLDQDGNLGGASVLAVLERHYAAPPRTGEKGLLLGYGPGFAVSALRTVWAG